MKKPFTDLLNISYLLSSVYPWLMHKNCKTSNALFKNVENLNILSIPSSFQSQNSFCSQLFVNDDYIFYSYVGCLFLELKEYRIMPPHFYKVFCLLVCSTMFIFHFFLELIIIPLMWLFYSTLTCRE